MMIQTFGTAYAKSSRIIMWRCGSKTQNTDRGWCVQCTPYDDTTQMHIRYNILHHIWMIFDICTLSCATTCIDLSFMHIHVKTLHNYPKSKQKKQVFSPHFIIKFDGKRRRVYLSRTPLRFSLLLYGCVCVYVSMNFMLINSIAIVIVIVFSIACRSIFQLLLV